jgi:curved DNA-binding protein CbpA
VGPVKDYYTIMEVTRNATAAQIRTRYRFLAKVFHPDVNRMATDDALMVELNEAYATLSDPAKRAAYNRLWDASYPSPMQNVREFPKAAPEGPVDLLGIFEKFAAGRVPEQFVNQLSPVLERKLSEHGVNARAATAESILEAVGWLKPKKGRKRA